MCVKSNKTKKNIIVCVVLLLVFGILIYPLGGLFYAFIYIVDIFPDDLCNESALERVFFDNKKVFDSLEIVAQSAINFEDEDGLNRSFKLQKPLQLQARLEHHFGIKLLPYTKTPVKVQSVFLRPPLFKIEMTLCGLIGTKAYKIGYVWISDSVDVMNEEDSIETKYNIRIGKKISGNWFIYYEVPRRAIASPEEGL